MTMEQRRRKPVPTEWNGVVFKSKSEACFAMYIDHYVKNRSHSWHPIAWEYEPKCLVLEDGYMPDFRLMFTRCPGLWCKLIEYKPSRPTDTYAIETLSKLAILSNHVGMHCNPCIQYGSFWENDLHHKPHTITLHNGQLHTFFGWADHSDEWRLRKMIGQHRFDLVSQLSEWKGYL